MLIIYQKKLENVYEIHIGCASSSKKMYDFIESMLKDEYNKFMDQLSNEFKKDKKDIVNMWWGDNDIPKRINYVEHEFILINNDYRFYIKRDYGGQVITDDEGNFTLNK